MLGEVNAPLQRGCQVLNRNRLYRKRLAIQLQRASKPSLQLLQLLGAILEKRIPPHELIDRRDIATFQKHLEEAISHVLRRWRIRAESQTAEANNGNHQQSTH